MKKQVLYFVAGIFLTLSVFSFWAFKKDKSESVGGSYTVVELHEVMGNNVNTKFVYADGKSEEKKYKKKTLSEGTLEVLSEMDALGFTYCSNYLSLYQGETNGVYLIFKKK